MDIFLERIFISIFNNIVGLVIYKYYMLSLYLNMAAFSVID